jgi:hypothetical protein
MYHDLTKPQKRALRAAAELAHGRDRVMEREDRDVHYLEARNSELPIVVSAAVADGIVAIEEVGEPARELIADLAASIRRMREEFGTRPAAGDSAEDDAGEYDPEAPLSVAAVVREIDALRDDTTLYVNRRTGEVRVMQHEYLPDEDEDDETEEDSDELPDWEIEVREEGRAMAADPDWIALLNSFDINDRDTMIRFARRARPAASRDLLDALHQRGAYRRFRDEIRRRGLQEEWDAFRDAALADLVCFALQEKEISFRR